MAITPGTFEGRRFRGMSGGHHASFINSGMESRPPLLQKTMSLPPYASKRSGNPPWDVYSKLQTRRHRCAKRVNEPMQCERMIPSRYRHRPYGVSPHAIKGLSHPQLTGSPVM